MNAERQMKIAALTWYDLDRPAEDIGAIIHELLDAVAEEQVKLEIACEALNEITEGAGRFSTDPLEHASNCVEDMKGLAIDALEKCQSDGNPLADMKALLRKCRDMFGEWEYDCHGVPTVYPTPTAAREMAKRIDAALGEGGDDATPET